MSSVSNDLHRKNQLASDWMHRGIDLASENSTDALEHAIRCFDEAIALRQTMPLNGNNFFRYGLSAGWINRGDAMARLGGSDLIAEAVKSYDEALTLLESLPLEENVLYPKRLAIAWINRGTVLQSHDIPNERWTASQCFRKAIDVLEQPSATAITDGRTLLAGAWVNLAGVLMGSNEKSEGARSAAHRALELVKSAERTDSTSSGIGMKARHTLCRLAVRDIIEKKPLAKDVLAQATEAVDEGIALAEHWKFQEGEGGTILARDIFRFGCRIYGSSKPHILAEYLMKNLAPERFGGAVSLDQEMFDAAQAAIWSALGNLQIDGFDFIATTRFEPVLSDIQELREVEDRLRHLHTSSRGR